MGTGRTRAYFERGIITMRDKGYYIYDYDLKNYYDCLGEKGKEIFLKWLTADDNYTEKKHPNLNYDYSTGFQDDVYRTGRNIVYLYTNEMGIPFYVGEGTTDRALSYSSRNESFKEKINEYGVCRIFVIAHNISKAYAVEIETLVINELLNRGWRLSNSRQTSVTTEQMSELSNDYRCVMDSINEITKVGLTSLLDDKDCFDEAGKVTKVNKSRMGSVLSNVV